MGNTAVKDHVKTEFEELKSDLNHSDITKVAAEYQEYLNKMENQTLDVAVTGQAGAGKSSFVNSFRSVNDDEKEAAKVAVTEGTTEPMAYPHPSFPHIKIWDLPGVGTCDFKAAEYLEKVKFEMYDVFIIVTSYRFTENDALLAKEIQRNNKKFYYVRTKIDTSIAAEKRKKKENFNEEETLEEIRKYCEDNLKRECKLSTGVFLISNWETHMYDFPLLLEKIDTELPDHKKRILISAVHIFSEEKLMMKKIEMKAHIKKVALVSCTFGVIPIPGASIACDIGILLHTLQLFCNVFGLNDRSLRFLARQTGKDFKELKSAVKKTPLANTVNKELVMSLLMKSSLWVAVSAAEVFLDFIPVIGSLFGGASSYASTYYFLNDFLDNVVEDAQNVRAKLLE